MKKLYINNVSALNYTPILTRVHENTAPFNLELKKQILKFKSKNIGINNSNRGGWHSDLNFLRYLKSDLKNQLLSIIGEGIKEVLFNLEKDLGEDEFDLKITVWANVAEKGNYSALHTHPDSIWSGVYYVEDGGDLNSRIVFPDSRIAAQMVKSPINPFTEETLELQPKAGLVVVFPSWLPHSVKPYNGDTQRISIGFNVST